MTRVEKLNLFVNSICQPEWQRHIVKTLLLRRMNTMAYLKDLEPELMDEVKHKEQQDASGVVIAKYPSARAEDKGAMMLDVRVEENFICYGTLASRWEVTKLNDELEGI